MIVDKIQADWPAAVVRVCAKLKLNGHAAWVVGGAVRDKIMHREPKDYDIATSCVPEGVMAYFDKVVPTGLKFGTVTVHDEGLEMEVTTFRADGRYIDGRRPAEVQYAQTIEEDLARRDFTINAMACDPVTGLLIDPYGGVGDILDKQIKAVGCAEDRFREDGLRPLRACRFVSQLDFNLQATTGRAIEMALPTFYNVSPERKWQELQKLLVGPAVNRGLYYLEITGLMQSMLPELVCCKGVAQNRHHTCDVYDHSLSAVRALAEYDPDHGDPILALATLVHDIGKPDTRREHPDHPGEYQFIGHEKLGGEMCEQVADRLRLSNEEKERLIALVGQHMMLMNEPDKDSGCRRLLRKLDPDLLEDHLRLRHADLHADPPEGEETNQRFVQARAFAQRLRRLRDEKPPMTAKDLAVSGKDVMDILGCKPGPVVGQALKQLLDLVLEDPGLNTKEALTAHLRMMP
jgi:putative nucleotidyltransferase with HDIG domain